MKKHLIAAAISAAVAVPALAQVTVYGTIDSSVSSVNKIGTDSISGTRVVGSAWTSNRLGFRGTEDLGGGMKANFGIETGYVSDTTNATTAKLGDRGVFVGASGAFGEVKIGGRVATLHNGANSGVYGNFTDLEGVSTVFGGRPENAIIYDTPTFSGVRAQFAIGNGEANSSGTKNNGDYQMVGLTGKVGAFSFTVSQATGRYVAPTGSVTRCIAFLGNASAANAGVGTNGTIGYGPTDGSCSVAAYTAPSTGTGGWSANATGDGFGTVMNNILAQGVDHFVVLSAGARATGAYDYKQKDTSVILGYDFGVANVQYAYLNNKSEGNHGVGTAASTAAGATAATNARIDRRAQGITVRIPVGAATPFVHRHEFKDRITSTKDHDATVVGVNYDLSKRTAAYAVYSMFDRESTSTVAHSNLTSDAGTAGSKSTAVSIGLRHSF